MDLKRIEAAVREILLAVGEDPDRPGIQETPRRVAEMYTEVLGGLTADPKEHIKVFDEAGSDEMVTVRDIPLYSCLLYTSNTGLLKTFSVRYRSCSVCKSQPHSTG